MTEQTNIRQFRAARNWTQPKMAKELGVHIATLVRLESKESVDRRTELALEHLAALHPVRARQKEMSG